MKYTAKKHSVTKDEIKYMEIVFDNGDYLCFDGVEVDGISLCLYDKLVSRGGYYHESFCPYVRDGFIKLKLREKTNRNHVYSKVYNEKEYNKDRVAYIKKRLMDERGMECVNIYNKNNRYTSYYGILSPELDGGNIILSFVPKANDESYGSDEHYINLPALAKTKIGELELDFENCEGFSVYSNEIRDMQIELDKNLVHSDNYIRQMKSGFLKLVFEHADNEDRQNHFFEHLKKGKSGNKQIEWRLVGNQGFTFHDVCEFYIHKNDVPSALWNHTERIMINDVRSEEEFIAIEKYEEVNESEWLPCYVGGYSEKQPDGSILIAFGGFALKNERFQKLLRKYSVKNDKNPLLKGKKSIL